VRYPLKPRAPFIWTAEQPIDPLGFQAVYRQAPPRATGTNRWFLFRREFDLNGPPDTAPARVTVDGRYQLFVNGVRVGRGPIRCSPLFQRYDLYDLAPYLQTGRNALGLVVHTYGVDTAWYEMVKGMWSYTFGDGAVWLEGEAETAEHTVLLDTGPDWRCLQADAAWRTDTQRMNSGLGFIEAMDARGMPEGWLRPGFDDSTWTRVQELKSGGGGPDALFGGFETRPFPTLIPRSIPTLEERPVIPNTHGATTQPVKKYAEKRVRRHEGLACARRSYMRTSQLPVVPRAEAKSGAAAQAVPTAERRTPRHPLPG
jgi:alpha-L-rhamnosidase